MKLSIANHRLRLAWEDAVWTLDVAWDRWSRLLEPWHDSEHHRWPQSVARRLRMIVNDPIDFIEGVLNDPETGRPFILTAAEKRFLRHAFELTPDSRLKYPELVFSAPKKSGKTGFAAMILLYVVRVLGGRYAEGIVLANDLEQAEGRGIPGSDADRRGESAAEW
jgi:hypothetical protein